MDVGSVLCVGSEWHRFPSSFLVPDYIKGVRWIDDGFRGLLPLPFNSTLGGTSAAPAYFNDKNQASDQQFVIHSFLLLLLLTKFWELFVFNPFTTINDPKISHSFLLIMMQLQDIDQCSLLVELHLQRPYIPRGSDLNTWEV